jgi:hypothetical protein
MELSPSPVAEAFGLGAPTGPLVAITGGPSAMHRSWRLSTSRGRFAVKAFSRDQHAHEAVLLVVTHSDLTWRPSPGWSSHSARSSGRWRCG